MRRFLLLTAVCGLMGVGVSKADTYQLVTSASDLEVGATYLVGYEETVKYNGGTTIQWALGAQNSSNYREAVDVVITEGEINISTEAVAPLVLEASGSAEYPYQLKATDGYLYNPSTSKNQLNVTSDKGETTSFCSITIGTDSKATIAFNSSTYALYCYYTGGSKAAPSQQRFNCYAKVNKIPSLYKKVENVTPTTVKMPVIEMVEMGEGFKVTMTTETEGAEIRYTTNGDEPTATSTLYSAPIDVWETTTFKAVAIKDGEMSRVATFVANPPMILENFMPLGDADPSEEYYIIVKGKMTAVYQNGAYLYVKDDSNNFALVYDATGTYTNGDTFNRLEGTFVTYNGQPEFKNVTIGEVTPGTPVEPTEAFLDEIAAYNLNKYFKIEGVAISDIVTNNKGVQTQATLTDVDGTTAVLYNRFNLELTEGENFTITGFVAVYTDKHGVTTYQFYPTEIVAAAETPVAPVPTIKVGDTVITDGSVDLKEGEVAEVSFELAEGVEVYYNLTETVAPEKAAAEDGLEYTKYTEPIKISKASTLTYYSVVNGVESEKATFTVTGGTTAITEINADANAPVEYFNLQGIRVANPENGVFIRRQGNTVTKVVK